MSPVAGVLAAVGPTHRDRPAGPGQRQDAVVLQQHRAPLGQLAGERLALRRGDVGVGRGDAGHVEEAGRDVRPHDAVGGLVDVRHAEPCPAAISSLIAIGRPVPPGVELLVEPGAQRRRVVGQVVPRAEVGHHPAVEPDLVLEDPAEQLLAAAGPVVVDLVERAHDRADVAAVDRDLVRQGVDLAQRASVHVGRAVVAVDLLLVRDEVLELRLDRLVVVGADALACTRRPSGRTSTGSSPRYSDVRPLRGSRPLAMPGPSRTLRCLRHASWAIAAPLS